MSLMLFWDHAYFPSFWAAQIPKAAPWKLEQRGLEVSVVILVSDCYMINVVLGPRILSIFLGCTNSEGSFMETGTKRT
jgi:hypothetical protein